MRNGDYIAASEIGEFVYCKRAWWLRVNGKTTTTSQMVRGIAHHESLLSKIDWSPRIKLIALLLIGIAGMIALIIIQSIVQ